MVTLRVMQRRKKKANKSWLRMLDLNSTKRLAQKAAPVARGTLKMTHSVLEKLAAKAAKAADEVKAKARTA